MNKGNVRSKILNFSAVVCFIISVALFITIELMKIDSIAEWYNKITDILMKYEYRVENLGNQWLIVLVIELNFVLKAVIPWIPISCICVISGVVFSWPIALAINITGLFGLFSIRYLWGKRLGGGNAQKILARYKNVYSFVDSNRVGSPLVLFGFRLIPCLPINSISQLYGSLGVEYWKYLLISFAGFSYKLFSYTIIGRNVYDPLSAKFLVPLISLFFLSGLAILAVNGVIHVTSLSMKRLGKGKANKRNKSEDDKAG